MRAELSCGRVCGVAELPLPPARHCEPAHLIPRPTAEASPRPGYRRDFIRLWRRHGLIELLQAVSLPGDADLKLMPGS